MTDPFMFALAFIIGGSVGWLAAMCVGRKVEERRRERAAFHVSENPPDLRPHAIRTSGSTSNAAGSHTRISRGRMPRKRRGARNSEESS